MMPRWVVVGLVSAGAALLVFWAAQVHEPLPPTNTDDQTPDLDTIIEEAALSLEDAALLRELERVTENLSPDATTSALDALDRDLAIPDVDLDLALDL